MKRRIGEEVTILACLSVGMIRGDVGVWILMPLNPAVFMVRE